MSATFSKLDSEGRIPTYERWLQASWVNVGFRRKSASVALRLRLLLSDKGDRLWSVLPSPLRFSWLCIRLRSVSAARWMTAYDDFKPRHEK